MKARLIKLALSAAFLLAGALVVGSVDAGEILGVTVSPNPITDPGKTFKITVGGKGYCDHVVVYWTVTAGGITNKSSVWEKKKFYFGTPPDGKAKVSSSGLGAATAQSTKLVTAEPAPGSTKCGKRVAKTTLTVYGKPKINPDAAKELMKRGP